MFVHSLKKTSNAQTEQGPHGCWTWKLEICVHTIQYLHHSLKEFWVDCNVYMSITFDNWIHTLCRVRAKSNWFWEQVKQSYHPPPKKKQQKTKTKKKTRKKNDKQNRRKRLVHVGELFHNLYQYTFFPIMAPPPHPPQTFSPCTSPGTHFRWDIYNLSTSSV